MSEEKRLEKLFERIRFLRDKQRFFEGFAAIVFGLYGLGVSLKDPIYRVITFGIAMELAIYAAYRHRAAEEELSKLWAETMRDPKPERLSLPLVAAICGIPLLVVSILQLLGIIP